MKTLKLSGVMLLLATFSCHSPLLEHSYAVDLAPTSNEERADQSENCPLQFSKHGLCAQLVWDGALSDESPASFTLRFWNPEIATASGPYVSPVEVVFAKLWMPSMGHGSAPVTLVSARGAGGEIIPGVYMGSNVNFIMPGAWQVKVQLKQGATIVEEAILNVQI
jgi:hypothetical protein